jgi:hypothetical protein
MLTSNMTRLMQKLSLIVSLFYILVSPAVADVFNSADFRINQNQESDSYTFTAQLPTVVVSSTDLILPKGCSLEQFSRQSFGSKSQLGYQFQCSGPLTDTSQIITPWYLDGARLILNSEGNNESLALKRSLNTMIIPLTSSSEVSLSKAQTIKHYLWQGMLHIWFGWDHLAFVLCLCLLAAGYRLLTLITTFTLGHSITLVLAHYELVTIPIAPVEVLIAFSIMLMAREALLQNTPADNKQHIKAPTTSAVLVILFGLIHGLGFASALSELGVPQNEIGLALLFFNLGVEVGQIFFVLALITIMYIFKNLQFSLLVRRYTLYFVGVLGAFWAVERLLGFNAGQLY